MHMTRVSINFHLLAVRFAGGQSGGGCQESPGGGRGIEALPQKPGLQGGDHVHSHEKYLFPVCLWAGNIRMIAARLLLSRPPSCTTRD